MDVGTQEVKFVYSKKWSMMRMPFSTIGVESYDSQIGAAMLESKPLNEPHNGAGEIDPVGGSTLEGISAPNLDSPSVPPYWRTADSSVVDRTIAEGLARFDPDLSGLYLTGCSMLRDLHQPGVPFLIAHIGREVSSGLIRILKGDDLSERPRERADCTEGNGLRESISGAFELPPENPLVQEWVRCHNVFAASCHFRSPGPDQGRLRSAFIEFTDLIRGSVAPFFEGHSEVRRLMDLPEPDERTLKRLTSLLSHPEQRRFFFANLEHPGWFTPLRSAKLLGAPQKPRAGSLGRTTWSESIYLKRMASCEPALVEEVLLSLDPTNRNPLVWHGVLDIALSLPAASAPKLIKLITQGVKDCPPWPFARQMSALTRYWAAEGQQEAFSLATLLTFLIEPEDSGTATSSWIDGLGHLKCECLRFLDSYELELFTTQTLPALEGLNPLQALKLLAKRLGQLNDFASRLKTREIDEALACHYWCESLEPSEAVEDPRAVFAIALCGLACRAAESRTVPVDEVWDILSKRDHPIFERIRYRLLTVVGPSLQQQLDQALSDYRLLSPPFQAKEVAALLRAQFKNASPNARYLFCHGLERGLDPDALMERGRRMAEMGLRADPAEPLFDTNGGPSRMLLENLNNEWRQKRLRWFHDELPEELKSLALRLGVTPEIPSEEMQALDEVGHYSHGARWVGNESPKRIEEIGQMSIDELTKFLVTWRPDPGNRADPFERGPSFRGLEENLTKLAKQSPVSALELSSRCSNANARSEYIEALLSGVAAAVGEGEPVDADRALDVISDAVQPSHYHLPTQGPHEGDTAASQSHQNRVRAALDLLRRLLRTDSLESRHVDLVWSVLEAVLSENETWINTSNSDRPATFNILSSRAINTLAGEFTQTLIDTARWHSRILEKDSDGSDEARARSRSVPWDTLLPKLQKVLAREGAVPLGTTFVIGQSFPFLWWLSPAWVEDHLGLFFDDGIERPIERPAWAAYLIFGHPYTDLFPALRTWYLKTALASQSLDPFRNPGDWTLTRSLGQHILGMYFAGGCHLGDPDQLLPYAFSAMSVEERLHCYWWISQDQRHESPEDRGRFAKAVVALWEWRLDLFEQSPAPQFEKEASGILRLLRVSGIEAKDAVHLALRTLDRCKGDEEFRGQYWGRISEIAVIDPQGALQVADRLIRRELEKGYGYLPFDEVAPILRLGLSCSKPEVSMRARTLINWLGEHGLIQFGDLLQMGPE